MKDLFWIDTAKTDRTTATDRPLVLLHGGFLDHGMWAAQIPALSARHRVIAPDARGHGGSANATGPFRHTDDLAALLRHVNAGPAVLVGVSMGGAIAIDTALEHPDLVAAAVVVGCGTSEPSFDDPWTQAVWGEWHAAMAAGDLDAAVETFTRFGAGPHRTPDDVDPAVVARLRRMTRSTMSKHTPDEPDHQVPVPDTWARAAGIEVPVLTVTGTLDSPDHNGMAERLARTVANGRTIPVDATAHYPNMERPDVFNALVEDFLRTL